jgi:3-phenylpropionate/trans-cinnamate dioxygenase ferredoxin reductase component
MNLVVVGAGLAGAHAVAELRSQGYEGAITLLGAEPHPPYDRPPLSKGLLLGEREPDSVFVHERRWYADNDVDLRTGATVTGLDRERSRVALEDGEEVPYDRLLLATGSQPRRLPAAEESGADVLYLRTLDDALALHARLSGHVLIVGGGWIGLEVASAARQAGARVTVVEPTPLPLAAILGPEIARVFADLHREHGVDLRLGTSVAALDRTPGGTRVRLTDGEEMAPDLVVVGIGVLPRDELARAAGLDTDRGVHVDGALRSSDPRIFAAGDIASHDHPILGRVRVEHWDNAIHQGRHAARAMLGDAAPYLRQPYFFTDQYDLGMEYVGHVGPDGYDEVVVRGDLASRVFTAFWVRKGRVVAGMQANDWDASDSMRSWVGKEAGPELRDDSVPLTEASA